MDNGSGRSQEQSLWNQWHSIAGSSDDSNSNITGNPDIVGEPRSIEELQHMNRMHLLLGSAANTIGLHPHNQQNSFGGGGKFDSDSFAIGMQPTPASMFLSATSLKPASCFLGLGKGFNTECGLLDVQLQFQHLREQQRCLGSDFIPSLQQNTPSPSLQEQLHEMQQLEYQVRMQQDPQHLGLMNGYQRAAATSGSHGQYKVQGQQQQQQMLNTRNDSFDKYPYSNALQAQIQGSLYNTSAFSSTKAMIPCGAGCAYTGEGTGIPPSLLSQETSTVVVNQTQQNKASSFLGEFPRKEDSAFPWYSAQYLQQQQQNRQWQQQQQINQQQIQRKASDMMNGDIMSSSNTNNAVVSGLTTTFALKRPGQKFPERLLDAPASLELTEDKYSQGTGTVEADSILKPLSAYNYFFTEERDRMLNGHGRFESEADEARRRRLLAMHWTKDRNKRRPHRKTHGKISFTTLSKCIGQKWRELKNAEKSFYKSVAKADMARYKEEVAKRDQQRQMEDLLKRP